MARRSRKRPASRRGASQPSSPLGWFITGLALGLGVAIVLFWTGVIPSMPDRPEAAAETEAPMSEPELLDDNDTEGTASDYDFFTVLPEMEVVVPERELTQPDQTGDSGSANAGVGQFILQAGSFRSAEDADQMKARLALLGTVANVQSVTVNDQTWHRVRIGPITGNRQADQLRRQLQDNGVDVLVLKASD